MSENRLSTEDLTLNLLAHQAFPRLAAAVRARSVTIIHAWEIAVRDTLPAADELTLLQLRNSLPRILREIADALASNKPHATYALIEGSKSHGATRFHENYNVQELIIEYRLLRRITVEQASEALHGEMNVQGQIALNMAIDTALQHGVIEFTEHLQRQMQAAAEVQSKYLSFLSHDLRNHLNHAMLHLQLLAAKLARSPEHESSVNDIQSVKRAILKTTAGMDRLLQAEQLRQESVELNVQPVDLNFLILEASKQLSHEAQSKGLEFDVDVPDGAYAESDETLLTLVLQNLLGNAVKYSSRGRVTISARNLSNRSNNGWILSISDQGPGIPPEKLEHIFLAFKRGDTYGNPGMGLGLCIASHAAKLLGAELEIDSCPDVGSTFRLVLPSCNHSSG